jgi:hypothetical protein
MFIQNSALFLKYRPRRKAVAAVMPPRSFEEADSSGMENPQVSAKGAGRPELQNSRTLETDPSQLSAGGCGTQNGQKKRMPG